MREYKAGTRENELAEKQLRLQNERHPGFMYDVQAAIRRMDSGTLIIDETRSAKPGRVYSLIQIIDKYIAKHIND